MPIRIDNNRIYLEEGSASTATYTYTGIDTIDVNGVTADIKREEKAGKVIGPKIYFKYVKSKLTKTDKTRLHKRLKVLQAAINSAKENEQQGLYEFLSQKLVSLLLESEADAIGCNQYIMKDTVEKYRRHVREDECSVHFDKLEEFPRVIPPGVQNKLRSVKKKGIFNEFYILHLSYKDGKIKTNKDKIREKDPILFGVFEEDPDKLYYVTDWVDEYCDLTLEKLVDELSDDDFDPVHQVPEMNEEYLSDLRKEVQDRLHRLKNTNQGNYRNLMQEEDKVNKKSIFRDILDYYKFNSPVVKYIRKLYNGRI